MKELLKMLRAARRVQRYFSLLNTHRFLSAPEVISYSTAFSRVFSQGFSLFNALSLISFSSTAPSFCCRLAYTLPALCVCVCVCPRDDWQGSLSSKRAKGPVVFGREGLQLPLPAFIFDLALLASLSASVPLQANQYVGAPRWRRTKSVARFVGEPLVTKSFRTVLECRAVEKNIYIQDFFGRSVPSKLYF